MSTTPNEDESNRVRIPASLIITLVFTWICLLAIYRIWAPMVISLAGHTLFSIDRAPIIEVYLWFGLLWVGVTSVNALIILLSWNTAEITLKLFRMR